MNRKSLGKQIQKYRERAGYSQEKLAEIIECSTIFISYIERGVKSPGLDKLMKIANALDVSVDILLGKDLASYNTERLKDIEQQWKNSLNRNSWKSSIWLTLLFQSNYYITTNRRDNGMIIFLTFDTKEECDKFIYL